MSFPALANTRSCLPFPPSFISLLPALANIGFREFFPPLLSSRSFIAAHADTNPAHAPPRVGFNNGLLQTPTNLLHAHLLLIRPVLEPLTRASSEFVAALKSLNLVTRVCVCVVSKAHLSPWLRSPAPPLQSAGGERKHAHPRTPNDP